MNEGRECFKRLEKYLRTHKPKRYASKTLLEKISAGEKAGR